MRRGSILWRGPLNPQEWTTRPGRKRVQLRGTSMLEPHEEEGEGYGKVAKTETQTYTQNSAESDTESWEAPITHVVSVSWRTWALGPGSSAEPQWVLRAG